MDSKMEQRSVQDIIDKFQPLLRKFELDDNLRITYAQEEPGTKVGDNYLSIVTRTKIEGIRGNQTLYKKSFITKAILTNEKAYEMCRIDVIFRNEAHIYQNVLPLLGPFGPKCILATPQEIIMEDLGERNYANCLRTNMLDFDHCKAVLQTLASYHAASLALKLNDPESFQELMRPLKEAVFPSDSGPAAGKCIGAGIELAIRCLKFNPEKTENVQKSIDLLTSYMEDAYSKMQQLINANYGKYQVLVHGDSWNNNILFHHDPDGNVVNVKLVDYQIVKVFSPVIDISYFLFSSAKSEVIENHLDDLYRIYHDFFLHDLRRLDVHEEDLRELSFSWLREEIRKFSVIGFIFSLIAVHAMFTVENEKLGLDFDVDLGTDKSWIDRIPVTSEKSTRFRLMVEKHISSL